MPGVAAETERLCYFNCGQNYSLYNERCCGAILCQNGEEALLVLTHAFLSRHPHQGKKAVCFPQEKPRNPMTVFAGHSLCYDQSLGAVDSWVAVQGKSEPIKPSRDKGCKKCAFGAWCLVIHSVVPFCSRLTVWTHCMSVLLGRGFSPLSQDPQVSWEDFRQKAEGRPSCLPGSPAGSPEAFPLDSICDHGEKPLLSSNPQTPGNPRLSCKTLSICWGKGSPFQCKGAAWRFSIGLAVQIPSLPLPIEQQLMDATSSKQAFHLFGSCHLPDFLLGMILHKSMASA